MSFDPDEQLKKIGAQEDSQIDLALAALALCAPNHDGISLQRYQYHFKTLAEDVAMRHIELLNAGADDDAATQLAALKHILSDKFDYEGDFGADGTLQNADIIQVINRARGGDVALGILYISAARSQGWRIEGLNTPGCFLCRIEKEGQRIIFDPARRAKVLAAPDLRRVIKEYLGPQAELSNAYFEDISNRDILIRLENPVKYSLIDNEDYSEALMRIERMRFFAPDEYRLLLDAGVLYAKVDKPMAAIRALEGYIEKTPNLQDRYEAGLILDHIREQMHDP